MRNSLRLIPRATGPSRARSGLALLLGLFLIGCDKAQPPQPRIDRSPSTATRIEPGSLPNVRETPGDVLDVTLDDVCEPGYTKKARGVPATLKRKVYELYGRQQEKNICCEVDHLIPLELGGSNRESNLWPEPYDIEWNARVKDRLERRLHKLVCSGSVDLATAQKAIAENWIAAYQRYIGVGLTLQPQRH